jgi:iron(III) transport system ATP-binding protein
MPPVSSIRPECWSLQTSVSHPANALRGRIGESVYLGEVARCRLRTDSADLKNRLNSTRAFRPDRKGQEFFAVAAADDVVVLKP